MELWNRIKAVVGVENQEFILITIKTGELIHVARLH